MNDEFLHALRRDPPPEFARELKRRLQRVPARRRAWSSIVRTMLAMFLIGGVAMAAALLLRDRAEPQRAEAPIADAPAPPESARVAQPAAAPVPNRQAALPTQSQPLAEQLPEKDIPVALLTSSLAKPLAQALVERLSKSNLVAHPRVGIDEADSAFRALCANTDFVMASRRIADTELALCRKWGIDVVEWHLGYQAVVLAAAPSTELPAMTPREVFLALARRIPDPAEPARLIDNPNLTWHDVDARFEYRNIDVLAPPDATTRELFVQLVMEAGCDTFPSIRSLKQSDWPLYNDVCHQLRDDGRYREVQLSNTLVTQQLWAQPNWLVILDYSYYARYRSELRTMLDGRTPTLATLSDGTYPAARPVYVYAQGSHVNWSPGTRLLTLELTSEFAIGPWGYLPRHGLVPLDDLERRKQREEHAR
jgi:phosphate transport system substrate-binding protein